MNDNHADGYAIPKEPPPGSIVVFGDGKGYPVTRGIGHLWFRTGWSGGKTWDEVVEFHADCDEPGVTRDELLRVSVLRGEASA